MNSIPTIFEVLYSDVLYISFKIYVKGVMNSVYCFGTSICYVGYIARMGIINRVIV